MCMRHACHTHGVVSSSGPSRWTRELLPMMIGAGDNIYLKFLRGVSIHSFAWKYLYLYCTVTALHQNHVCGVAWDPFPNIWRRERAHAFHFFKCITFFSAGLIPKMKNCDSARGTYVLVVIMFLEVGSSQNEDLWFTLRNVCAWQNLCLQMNL